MLTSGRRPDNGRMDRLYRVWEGWSIIRFIRTVKERRRGSGNADGKSEGWSDPIGGIRRRRRIVDPYQRIAIRQARKDYIGSGPNRTVPTGFRWLNIKIYNILIDKDAVYSRRTFVRRLPVAAIKTKVGTKIIQRIEEAITIQVGYRGGDMGRPTVKII